MADAPRTVPNYAQASITYLHNTIVVTANGPSLCGGVIISEGYNQTNEYGNGYLSHYIDRTNADLLLAPLANYGGLTPTHALLPNSPAIDVGAPQSAPFPWLANVYPSLSCSPQIAEIGANGLTSTYVTLGPFPAEQYKVTANSKGGDEVVFNLQGRLPSSPSILEVTSELRHTSTAGGFHQSPIPVGALTSGAFATNDFDGDGQTNLSVWRENDKTGYTVHSGGGSEHLEYWENANKGDVPAPGKYDGDNKDDHAMWHENEGIWQIKPSNGGQDNNQIHGSPGDKLVGDLADAIYECVDGTRALEAFLRHRPDWVLMDIKMPGLDGISASIQISRADPESKIVIVTDYDDERLRVAARHAGARVYVSKERLLDLRRCC